MAASVSALSLSIASAVAPPAGAAPTTGGTLGGTAWRDDDQSGTRAMDQTGDGSTIPVEPGIGGVLVVATCLADTGALAADPADDVYAAPVTGLTADDGTYSLAVSGSPCRVEFIPPVGDAFLQPGPVGADNASTTQFVTLSGGVGSADVSFANPGRYCDANADIVTQSFCTGPDVGNPNADKKSIIRVGATASGQNSPTEVALSKKSETGSVWGIAYRSKGGDLFAAANEKRFIGYTAGSTTGTIFTIPDVRTAPGTASIFVDLNTLPGAPADWAGPTKQINSTYPDQQHFIIDRFGYQNTGKVALGDLDVAEDGSALYTVNLVTKQLVEIPIGTAATAVAPTSFADLTLTNIPMPANCPAADVRPYGLGVKDGVVYLGEVCSAESTQDKTALRAYVWAYDPAANSFAAAPTIEFSLDVERGCAEASSTYLPWSGGPCAPEHVGNWRPWQSDITAYNSLDYWATIYNFQPILSDIEFDGNDMIIGFKDRWGDQNGHNVDSPDGSSQNHSGVSEGDIVMACSTDGQTFTIEGNGACGTRVSGNFAASGDSSGSPPWPGRQPSSVGGGAEFFWGDFAAPFGSTPWHDEAGSGGLALNPATHQVAMTMFDPLNPQGNAFNSGYRIIDSVDGSPVRGYMVNQTDPPNLFGKANGMGDIEFICDRAPVEIGNRIWVDANANGIQDPGEQPASGVTVHLYAADGTTLVGTAVTNLAGEYYFQSKTSEAAAGTGDHIGGGVVVGSGNVIRVDNPADFAAGGPLEGMSLTSADQTTPATADVDDGIDSDAAPVSGFGQITVPAASVEPGFNNHTYDVGYVPVPPIVSLGNFVWRDDDNDGTFDSGTEPPLDNVTVRIFRPGFGPDGIAGNTDDSAQIGADQLTSSGGYYLFTGLLPGDYVVELVTPAGMMSSTGGAGSPFEGTATPDPDDVATDSDDNGSAAAGGVTRSKPITLTAGGEPTAEPATPGHPDATPDANANYTVDFGFTPIYAIGNIVWFDAVPDGLRDPANALETPVSGATVRLFDANGTEVPVGPDGVLGTTDDAPGGVTTGADGQYYFDGLPGGTYSVQFTPPAGYGFTTDAPATPDALNDSNPAPSTGRTPPFTLGATLPAVDPSQGDRAGLLAPKIDRTIDAGLVVRYSLGNRVWFDADNSGAMNGTEAGIGQVVVNLLHTDGSPVLDGAGSPVTDVTDASGFYRFDDLLAGDYIVEIAAANFDAGNPLAGGLPSTGAAQEADPDGDVDVNDNGLDTLVAGAIRSGVVTLGPGLASEPTAEVAAQLAPDGQGAVDARANMTVDFGIYVPTYAVGNYVWFDADRDGKQGAPATEPPVAGATVRLFRPDGSEVPVGPDGVLGTTDDAAGGVVTPTTGLYYFDNLPAGDYYVTFTPPAGMQLTTNAPAVPDTAADSNPDPATGRTPTFTLGQSLPDVSAGAGDPALLGDKIDRTVDAGLVVAYSLGNRVWFDDDNSGDMNGAEAGIAGVEVDLLHADGTPVLDAGGNAISDVTDADGFYRFDALVAGDYIVEIAAANFAPGGPLYAGHPSTGAAQEADPDGDVDVNDNGLDTLVAGAIRSAAVTLGSGLASEPVGEAAGQLEASGQGETDARANMTVDFGIYVPKYTLGNLVWSDFDNDGTADPGEAPIAGVTLQLLMEDPANPGTFIPATDANGNPVADQTTGADGLYQFTNLLEGTYKVVIPAGQAPLAGTKSSGTPNPTANDDTDNDNNGVPQADGSFVSGPVTLGPLGSEPTTETDGLATGQPDQDTSPGDSLGNWSVDFGFFRGIRIGNLVWLDGVAGDGPTFDNGIVDPGETPLGGVQVELWLDNGDGTFDPATDTRLDQTSTDSDGNYVFEGVEPGAEVFVAIPSIAGPTVGLGARSSTGQSAGPDAADNDDDGAPLGTYASVSGLFTVPAAGAAPTGEADGIPAADGSAETEANNVGHVFPDGNSDLRIDFGFVEVPIYRLGNLVWIDADKDGIADVGEAPLPGVRVELYDDAGNLSGFTMTGPDGKYLFENLTAGAYEVRIPTGQAVLAGYFSSPVNEASADLNGDNNDNGTLDAGGAYWTSGPVTLGDGDFADEPTTEVDGLADGTTDDDAGTATTPDDRSNLTVDFGFYQPRFALGNEVWFDLDNSGTINGTEAYVPDGVVVNLLDGTGEPVLDAGGNPVTTTTTAGRYLFDDLLAGDYIVELAASNFGPGGLLEGYASSTGQNTGDTLAGDRADHGDDDTSDGIQSAVVTLAEGTEPVGENPSETTTAPDDNANMTIDFGIYPTFSLGNEVWIDLDDSGTINGTEAYVPDGVVVNLLDSAGNPVLDDMGAAVTTTTAGGLYLFDDLPAGTYIVELAASNFAAGGLLAGYRSSTLDAGDTQTDRDDNGAPHASGAIRTGAIALGGVGAEPAGENPTSPTIARDTNSDLTVDLGVVPMFALGNEVWIDLDDSGDIGAGEPYVPDGVKLNLLDATGNPVLVGGVAVTTTTSGGKYLFDRLVAGTYIVELDASNFAPGAALQGMRSSTFNGTDNGSDQDDNGAPVAGGAIRSGAIVLGGIGAEPAGENPTSPTFAADANGDLTVDFGLVPLFAIGNEVWIDANDSGILDNGEAYVPDGVVVNLLKPDGTPVLNSAGNPLTTTTTSGHYVFDNLLAGDYLVEVAASNFAVGGPLQGYRSSTGQTTGEALADDRHDHGDDAVADGVRSTVVALSYLAEPVAENPTDATVAADPNANLVIDFGVFRPTFSLGNQIWYDLDDDGTIDAGEPPVPTGTTVTLFRTDGTQLATTTTDAFGLYLFTNLDAGDYYVEIALPTGYRSSTPTETGDIDNADHGDEALNGANPVIRSGVVSLTEGDEPTGENPDNDPNTLDGNENLTVDLGIVPLFSLGNEIWFDLDNDGIIDAGEPYVPDGVAVNLRRADGSLVLDSAGNPVTTTTTAGLYLFDGLLAGDYIVEIAASNFAPGAPLEGWVSSTGQDLTDTDRTDHGAPSAGGGIRSGVVTLSLLGEPAAEDPSNDQVTPDANSNLTVDFGLSRLAVGNRVWIDIDNDGVRDATEPGVGGVTVELWAGDAAGPIGNAPLATTVTDGTGYYLFDGLQAGTYVIRIPAGQLAPGGPLDGYISTEGNGTAAPDADDNVDDDDNGTQDDAAGWVQTLPFDLAAASEPTSEADLADGYTQTSGDVDIDANVNLTVDLGFVATPPLSLGNRVWTDIDNDGVMDAAETPIDGVTVQLFRDANADGVPDDALPFQTDITAGGGYYLFIGLAQGNYVVVIPRSNFAPGGPLAHMMSSTGSTPANSDVDLDDSGIQRGGPAEDVRSSTVRVSYYDEPTGEAQVGPDVNTATDNNSNLTVDFGFHPLGSLGDYVWFDTNRDGKQDPTETGVDGVKVNLYDGSGVLVATATTSGGGKYLFEDLVPGPYTVEFVISTIPAGYLPTTPNASGVGEEADSDGDVTTGRTTVYTVTPGGHEPRVDFGIHRAEVDLEIVKTLEGKVVANQNSTWKLVVSNKGRDPETGVITVIDTLPAELSFISAAGTGWECAAAGRVVTCTTSADLLAGQSLPPILVVAKVAAGTKVGAEITNGATVSSPGDDPFQPNNSSLAKAPVVKAGTLPGTGADVWRLLALAAFLVLAGTMMRRGRRRLGVAPL